MRREVLRSMLLLVINLGLLAGGAVNAKDRVVEAEAFALKDSKGKARGGIRVNEAGGAAIAVEASGAPSFTLLKDGKPLFVKP